MVCLLLLCTAIVRVRIGQSATRDGVVGIVVGVLVQRLVVEDIGVGNGRGCRGSS